VKAFSTAYPLLNGIFGKLLFLIPLPFKKINGLAQNSKANGGKTGILNVQPFMQKS